MTEKDKLLMEIADLTKQNEILVQAYGASRKEIRDLVKQVTELKAKLKFYEDGNGEVN